jgi:hypothetical protein
VRASDQKSVAGLLAPGVQAETPHACASRLLIFGLPGNELAGRLERLFFGDSYLGGAIMKQLAICLVGVLAALCLSTQQAWAVLVASDNASDATYNDGWGTTDDGGSGFDAWSTVGGTGSAGTFLATNSSHSQINTAGDAFGLYANSGGLSQAIRSFSNSLNVTDTFSLAMDNGSVDSGRTVGFALQNGSGSNLFEFFFVGGATNYQVNAANVVSSGAAGFTNAGLQLSFTLTDADSFSFTIDRLADGLGTNVVTATGDLLTTGAVSRFRLFNANAGPNGERDLFFNSFEVTAVPEASALLCLGTAGLAAGLWRLRKRSGRRQAA